jgi:hypothetical protein
MRLRGLLQGQLYLFEVQEVLDTTQWKEVNIFQ